MPTAEAELADVLDANSVFGPVTPHQKRAMVSALQSRGHVVAMTGDGVNDVLALKDADIGIAMGSGSSAARSVAQFVLLDGAFNTIPAIVGEGRRVIHNIERVANLFVTKTVYAFLLAVLVGAFSRPFPFVPRHLTLVATLTIGAPAFFLALAPTAARARAGFVNRVMRFAAPVGRWRPLRRMERMNWRSKRMWHWSRPGHSPPWSSWPWGCLHSRSTHDP